MPDAEATRQLMLMHAASGGRGNGGGGVVVHTVQHGSTAEKCGLRGVSFDPVTGGVLLGDVIIQVGEIQTKTVDELVGSLAGVQVI